MSRSGYIDDDGDGSIAMWRGQVASATRGRRGQKFFSDLIASLDAMPEKRLITKNLEKEGEVCALGALGRARGITMTDLDPEDPHQVSHAFDIAHQLAAEVVYMNDEYFNYIWDVPNPDTSPGKPRHLRRDYTPEERWKKMRDWAAGQLKLEPAP